MQIRAALSTISDPVSGKNIIVSGRISDLSVSPDGKARFLVNAAEDDDETVQSLLSVAKDAVLALESVESVQALATRHKSPSPRPSPPSGPQQDAHNNPLGLKDFARQGAPDKKQRIEESKQALEGVDRVIAIASGKGGVGKSTLTVNLAMALKAAGKRIGILDCDVYGPSLPTLLGLQGKPVMKDGKIQPMDAFGMKVMSIGLLVDTEKALAWRGPMVMGAVRQMINDVDWGELDILLIDTPPGTGDAHLTLIQTGQLDGAIIVTTPQGMALADVRRGIALFQQTKVKVLGLIENMAWLNMPDGTKQFIFGKDGGKRMAELLEINFLGAIPLEPDLAKASDKGEPLSHSPQGSDPESKSGNHAINVITDIAATITNKN